MESNENFKKYRVTKSNALITARYKQKYTIHEQKTILWILSQIDYSGSDLDKEYVLPVKEYAETIGIHPSNIYREAKSVAEGLSSKTIKIENSDGSWMVCSWLSGMRYEKGNLYIEIYSRLKPHLLKLKEQFTSYQLGNVLALNSVYAIRLYELLAQRRFVGECIFSIDELRGLLGLQGNELIRFTHFKTKVLEISFREINSKTDIQFQWEPIKIGRKIEKIKFILEKKEINTLTLDEGNSDIRDRLLNLGFKKKQVDEILLEYNLEKITFSLDYLEKTKEKIKNSCGFFLKSMEEGYVFAKKHSPDSVDVALSSHNIKVRNLQLELSHAISGLNSHLAKINSKIKSRYQSDIDEIKKKLQELDFNDEKVIDS